MESIFDALRELAEKEDEKIKEQLNSAQAPNCPIDITLHPHKI